MLKSTMLDQLKKQILLSADGHDETENTFSAVDRFLFYRYMSAVSNRSVTLPRPQNLNLNSYIANRLNNLFTAEVDDEFKTLLKYVKAASVNLNLSTMPQDAAGWSKVFNAISDVLSGTTLTTSLREQVLFAAVSLCVIEAEIVDYSKFGSNGKFEYSTRALKSLNSVCSSDQRFEGLLEYLNIRDASGFKKIPQLEFMRLQQKYLDISNSYTQKKYELSPDNSSQTGALTQAEYYEAYATDARIIADLIAKIISADEIDLRDHEFGNTLLVWACTFVDGDVELAKAAIAAGIDVNASSTLSPAVYAMNAKSPELLEILLNSQRLHITPAIISTLSNAASKNPEYASILNKYFPDAEAANNLEPVISGLSFSG